MKVSVVIPNFNGEKLLRKNLPGVLKVAGVDEIVVVDDGSTDESLKFIKSADFKKPPVKLVENKENLGFSSAVNRGVEKASGEIVVLLNTDVSPREDFLKSLISHFDDPQIFAVGCLDKSIEDGETVLRGRGVGKWQRGFLVHSRGEVDKSNTLWVAGGSGAFRKEIWEKLRGMDELYSPFYWEDIDLSWRAQKAGYKILFEPKSVVVHRHQEGIIRQKHSLSKIKTIAYRNQLIFVWKNISDPAFLLDHFLWLPYYILRSLLILDLAFMRGFFLAFLKLPRVLVARRSSSEIFVKSDREIMQ